ncbi:phosphatidylserine decarboxylase family protein [bacterium]|nr:phosphatidylserine decarboxylase family protein [bacterium]
MAPEGYPFITIAIGLMLAGYFIHPLTEIILVPLFIWVVSFFRNPAREVPQDPNAIICPADGTVIFIGEVDEHRFLKRKVKKVSIFMSPFNVHVNRVPVDGTITQVSYNKGKYFAAYAEKASLDNEQNALVVKSVKGFEVLFIQIAGFLARRIVSYAQVGDSYKKGDIFGLIRFGSRMDVYMPVEADIQIKMDQKVKAGETILAQL